MADATSLSNGPAVLTPAIATSSDRASEIDGIRGWAAFIVLLFHVFWEMLGHVLPQARNPFTAVALNGGTAVSIFFVLSGDALSAAYFSRSDPRSIDRLLVKRYFRLTVPILMACSLVFGLMRFGFDFHARAVPLLHIEDWLGDVLTFDPKFFGLLQYALRDVYTNHTKQGSYIPFLWTMPVEMIGSMLVFLLCYAWDRLWRPSIVLFGLTIACLLAATPYALFGVGMLLGYARKRGTLNLLRSNPSWQYGAILLVVCALVLSGAMGGHHASPFVAIMLVVACYTQRSLRSFFLCPLSRFLGEISFPLYLVQFPVIISLMSWLLVRASDQASGFEPFRLIWIATATVAASVALASIFRYLERIALRRIDNIVVRILN